MPWRSASIMDQRVRFVLEAEQGLHSTSELCRRYGISRPTGERYEAEGTITS